MSYPRAINVLPCSIFNRITSPNLKTKKIIWKFSHLELEKVLQDFFDNQGKTERIKNFPYPIQFSSLTYYFTWIFILLLPSGLISDFVKLGEHLTHEGFAIGQYFIWALIPFSTIVSWFFHTMLRVSVTGDNPFEGSANDVPISSISRGIEIDLRQMLNEPESEIPKQFEVTYNIQM